jgi:tryptophan-rich sensory protein
MDLKRLTFAVAPVAAAAVLGGLASRDAPEVYARLRKPDWAPPATAFGPVWTGLYAGTALAGWLMYPRAPRGTKALHLTQLALNGAWSAAFFGVRDKRASLAIIGALDATLAAEIARLRTEDPRAAALLTPYLAWTGFATALNAAVSEPEKA